jgi:PAS domain S-box-containing protein
MENSTQENSGKNTIFLIDPQPGDRSSLGNSLRDAGWDCVASDGLAPLPEKEARVSLILLAAGREGLNFIETVRSIRAHPASGQTPILLVARGADEQDLIEALKQGADDVIFPPFTAGRLVERVGALASLARLRSEESNLVSVALKQLRHSERRYSSYVSASTEILLIATADGHFTEQHPKWEKFTGQAPEEYRGLGWLAAVHPEDRHRAREFWKDPELENPPVRELEFQLRHRDGSYRQMHLIALPSEEPSTREWVASMTDITEKRTAQESLRDREEKLRLILDSSKDFAIFTMDMQGRVTMWNAGAERLLGYTEDEICGIGFDRIFIQEDIEAGIPGEELENALKTGRGADKRWHKRKDGSLFWADGLVMPLQDTNNQTTGFLKIIRDFTEQKKSEDQLRALTEELELKVADRTRELEESRFRLRSLLFELNKTEQKERQRVAAELHDSLAQLLTAGRINLESSIQQIKGVPPPGLQSVVEIIAEATRTTRNLMAELSTPPVLESEDLVATIGWVIEKMSEEGLVIDYIHDEPHIPLNRDLLTLIYQAVRELLLNVCKHAGVSDATVHIHRSAESLVIEVADEGRGFFPTDAMRVPGSDSGFGLLNIQERLRWLRGSLELDSSPGHGTLARITLPLQEESRTFEEALEAAAPAIDLERPRSEAGRPAVLLVDDHRMVREGFRSVIEAKSDIRVVGEASDGLEALEKARELHPDVVVMDINMPRMNGLEATRRILQEMPDTLVIGLSLHGHEEMAESIRKAGGAAYVSKEEAFNKLCDTIHAEVDKRDAKRQPVA